MNVYRLNKKLMGSVFELILHFEDEKKAMELLHAGIQEIERIEDLISEFRENTVCSMLNRNAGMEAIETGEEVYNLIKRCTQISALSGGTFDITVGPLKKIYRFKNSDFRFPGENEIKKALDKVGYKSILLSEENKTVKLEKKEMSCSFAAVGKGYAADRVKALWLENGVTSAVISASGDMCTIGKSALGTPWKIGIADPACPGNTLFYIPVTNASVATSGDYEQYFTYNGKKFGHNINPLNGIPVSEIKSVSVISPAAELSDALATAVMIMGVEQGLDFIDQLPDTHCLLIDRSDRVHLSKNIELQYES